MALPSGTCLVKVVSAPGCSSRGPHWTPHGPERCPWTESGGLLRVEPRDKSAWPAGLGTRRSLLLVLLDAFCFTLGPRCRIYSPAFPVLLEHALVVLWHRYNHLCVQSPQGDFQRRTHAHSDQMAKHHFLASPLLHSDVWHLRWHLLVFGVRVWSPNRFFIMTFCHPLVIKRSACFSSSHIFTGFFFSVSGLCSTQKSRVFPRMTWELWMRTCVRCLSLLISSGNSLFIYNRQLFISKNWVPVLANPCHLVKGVELDV